MEKPKDHPIPCSDDFLNAIMRSGSLVQECGFCGRIIFADCENAGDWDEGELEHLRNMSQTKPAEYVADGENDSVAYGELSGRMLVWGCPCNGGRKYEDFIWEHKEIIGEYLLKRTRNDLEEAVANHTLAEKVAKGLSEMEKMAAEVSRMQTLLRLNGLKAD